MFAVLQRSFEDLDPVKAADAYVAGLGLNRIDAMQRIRQRPNGILAENLDERTAGAFQQALEAAGFGAIVRPLVDLRPNPKSYQFRAGRPQTDGLLWADVLGRDTVTPWSEITLIAVGVVAERPMPEPTSPRGGRSRAMKYITRGVMLGGIIGAGVGAAMAMRDASRQRISSDAVKKARCRVLADIYIGSPETRLRLVASEFDYRFLGEKLTTEFLHNFSAVLQGISDGLGDTARLDDGAVLAASGAFEQLPVFKDAVDWDAYTRWRLQMLDA